VVRTLGVANLAEHSPIPELWRIVSAAGRRAAGDDGYGHGARASDKLFSIPEVKPVREPVREPKRVTDPAPGFDDITRNAVPADNLGVDLDAPIAVDPPDDDRRKPNRRITGAGATSRRRAASVTGKTKGANHRSPTEVGDVGEIEVVDETDVLMPPPGTGTK
jgi:hypothetical protein